MRWNLAKLCEVYGRAGAVAPRGKLLPRVPNIILSEIRRVLPVYIRLYVRVRAVYACICVYISVMRRRGVT